LNILGISCFYHDSASCLLRDGLIVGAAQEERFSRKKHDPRFPAKAIKYCLEEGGIAVQDLDYVVFYDKPILTFDRLLMSYLSVAPKGLRSWLEAIPPWLGKKLHVPKVIRREIGYEKEVLFTEHHESHAASAFYPSPFEEAAILTVDGVGEWATASYGFGRKNQISLLKELHFPNSVGLLYSAFTYFAGFRVNSGEYKLMGLAPYGRPRFKDLILSEIVDLKDDGSIGLNLAYFDFLGGLRMTNRRFSKLFGGPPRKPEADITEREMDLAASIQAVCEEIILRMVRQVYKETGLKKLCLAGGVALNCVANGRILRESDFDEVWIQPAAGDAGGAVGAALSVWHRYLGNGRPDPESAGHLRSPYMGPSFSNEIIKAYLEKNGYPFVELDPENKAKTVAAGIAAGKIVGYLAGRMEFGPRALGGRSILGDARSEDIQKVMNLKIKFRESFRPFAPSVLTEKSTSYFDINTESPYMLLTANVRKERQLPQPSGTGIPMLERLKAKRSDIPAVTHLDYSARLQTVGRNDNRDYYEVISEFYKLTGCPVIVNTSFNVRGEPIVCTPEDAYRCFMRTKMDVLVMENCMLLKEDQPTWGKTPNWRETLELD